MKNKALQKSFDYWQKRLKNGKSLSEKEKGEYFEFKRNYHSQKKSEQMGFMKKKKISNKVLSNKKGLFKRILSIFKK